MSLDNDAELDGDSAVHQFDLDRFGEILRDALAVPANEGLALLLRMQVARAAGAEASDLISAPDLDPSRERAA
jgi:hypothetical protein